MAITKRITIKRTVSTAINYIIDGEKTVSGSEKDNEKAISYISNEVKTNYGELVYGHLCHPITAANEFEMVRKQNLSNVGKSIDDDQGVLAHHFIVSFRADEVITPKEALEFGKELVERQFKYHQAVIAVHTNTDNLHIHIVMNSHTTDPIAQYGKLTRMKYGSDKESYREFREASDNLCREKGLSIEKPLSNPERSRASWYENKDRKDGSTLWKNKIKDKIEEAVSLSNDWEEYKVNLNKLGVEINERGATISYRLSDEEMIRPIREKRLGGKYIKEEIIKAIENPPKEKEEKYYYNNNLGKDRVKALSITGKPKPTLELILNLAESILEKKVAQDISLNAIGKSNFSEKREIQRNLQLLYDTQKMRRDYGIGDELSLKDRIKFVGAKINNYKISIDKLKSELEKESEMLEMLHKLKETESLNSKDIESIKAEIKEYLDNSGFTSIEEYIENIEQLEDNIEKHEKALKEVKKEYVDLLKIKEVIQKAEDKSFLKIEQQKQVEEIQK